MNGMKPEVSRSFSKEPTWRGWKERAKKETEGRSGDSRSGPFERLVQRIAFDEISHTPALPLNDASENFWPKNTNFALLEAHEGSRLGGYKLYGVLRKSQLRRAV